MLEFPELRRQSCGGGREGGGGGGGIGPPLYLPLHCDPCHKCIHNITFDPHHWCIIIISTHQEKMGKKTFRGPRTQGFFGSLKLLLEVKFSILTIAVANQRFSDSSFRLSIQHQILIFFL